MSEDYREVNQPVWDERAAAHAASPGYHIDAFREDPTYLSHVVRFDYPRLGDISGLRAVHLQCHIGTDTVSLARLGARVTGLDFSGASVEQARALAREAGAEVTYVEGDVYEARRLLEGDFDLVYTGVGALCWLPDVRRWAATVGSLLVPGGRLFIREGHPVLWALADMDDEGRVELEYPYFEQREPLVWDEPGTYVESDVDFQHTRTIEWNHGVGEILTAVLDAGLQIQSYVEHDSVPWDAFPGHMTALPDDEWQLTDRPQRLPHSYTLSAVKR